MSPERPEDDDFLEDEEQEEYGQRSIFATGWFRAVLVLLVLAVIAVIAVPLIGGWFEPTPPGKVTTTPLPPVQAPAPTPSAPPSTPPSTPRAETPPPAATPTAPSTPSAAQAPTPTSPPAATTPATPPPSVNAPVPRPEPSAPQTPSTPPSTATPSPATPRTKATDRTASAPSKSAVRSTSGGNYWVQVGAFKESRNAEGLARTLRSEGFPAQVATVTRQEPLHVVRIGGYADRAKAAAARQELQGKGHSGFVTQGPAK